jgi:hypothetical protein
MSTLLAFLIAFQAFAFAYQQPQPPPPKSNRDGNPLSIVRNDATAPITIESRINGQWQPLRIDPGKDAAIPGDHIRVATTRPDSALVTIDLPVQAGKKYRVYWNAQASLWDFAITR